MTPLRSTRKSETRRCTELMRDILLGYRARLEEKLHGSGVTLAQLRMLKAIRQQSGVSAATIARHIHITPQTLHTMLARAVREGWITRGSSEKNSRFVTAALTSKGSAILQHGMDLVEEIDEQVWRTVPVQQLRAVCETLESGLARLSQD